MSKIFQSKVDEDNEQVVASIIENKLNCKCFSLGKLDHIDWHFVRDDRLIGIGELKSRTNNHDKYETVYLSLRKWYALVFAAEALSVTPLFIVKFTDGVYWIRANEIDARVVKMLGRPKREGSSNDRELIIEVPIKQMKFLAAGD